MAPSSHRSRRSQGAGINPFQSTNFQRLRNQRPSLSSHVVDSAGLEVVERMSVSGLEAAGWSTADADPGFGLPSQPNHPADVSLSDQTLKTESVSSSPAYPAHVFWQSGYSKTSPPGPLHAPLPGLATWTKQERSTRRVCGLSRTLCLLLTLIMSVMTMSTIGLGIGASLVVKDLKASSSIATVTVTVFRTAPAPAALMTASQAIVAQDSNLYTSSSKSTKSTKSPKVKSTLSATSSSKDPEVADETISTTLTSSTASASD